MRIFLFAFFIVMSLMPNTAFCESPEAIGRFNMVQGTVTLIRSSKTKVTNYFEIKQNDPIYAGDHIETGEDGYITLLFIDETELSVGPHGKLTIDEYVYDPSFVVENKSRFNILNAAFSYIGGKMAEYQDSDISIDVNFGSIGIRGTKILRTMRDMECWIFLEEGHITVSNDAGTVELLPGEGTRLSDKAIAPVAPEIWSDEKITLIRNDISPVKE